MGKSNFYQEIKTARKEERVAWAKRYEVASAMKKELAAAEKRIRGKYEPTLKSLETAAREKSGKVWSLGGEYRDYGRFFTKRITDIFAVLLTYIEGEKYVPYRNWENHDITENSIVIKEAVNKQYDKIDYATLEELYKNGDLVMLNRGFSNMVDFYDKIGNPRFFFGKFHYLREFVNRLIQYRIDNGLKDIEDMTVDRLYVFMCSFIQSHPALAQKNKEKRDQMLIGQNGDGTIDPGYKRLQMMLKTQSEIK